jgi:hypothetical protein
MDMMFDWSDYEKLASEIDDLDGLVTGAFDHADAILHWLDKIHPSQ